MMTFLKNGEPYVFKHQCSEQEKGCKMTEDEKREFFIQNLLDIYGQCNMTVERCPKPQLSMWQKLLGKKVPAYYPDLVIRNFHGSKGKNAYYIVVPDGTSLNIKLDAFPEEMKQSYVKVIYGSAFNFEHNEPNCFVKGDSYATRFTSKAVFPIQRNYPMTRILSDKELAQVVVHAWKRLNIVRLEDYLDKDFHYVSDFVFDEMSSRKEYIDYLMGKFVSLHRTNSISKVALGRNSETGEWSALIKQELSGRPAVIMGLSIKSKDGRIVSMRMSEMDMEDIPDEARSEVSYSAPAPVTEPEPEQKEQKPTTKSQGHGDHNDIVMPADDLIKDYLRPIISESKVAHKAVLDVSLDEKERKPREVFGLVHGEQPLQMCSLIVNVKEEDTNAFASIYPILKSPYAYDIVIEEVEEWEAGLEASVCATVGERTIHFFPIDYYAHKDQYQVGKKIKVELSGLAYILENLEQDGFAFEGQKAIDFLQRTGQEPTYNEKGEVEPVRFDLTNMVAYIPKNEYPEDAEFQSKISNIEEFDYLGIRFCSFDILIAREDDTEVKIKMCSRKDRLPKKFEVDIPIRGVLWLQARLSE